MCELHVYILLLLMNILRNYYLWSHWCSTEHTNHPAWQAVKKKSSKQYIESHCILVMCLPNVQVKHSLLHQTQSYTVLYTVYNPWDATF